MLIRRAILDGVVEGEIDLAFRRWDRPSVKAGTRQRTPVGIIEITAIDMIALEDITDQEALRAGAASAAEITAWLQPMTGSVYRIGLTYGGPDPRVALRRSEIATHEEHAGLAAQLARFDESGRRGPWTIQVLKAIEDAPGTPATELAERFGREKRLFKTDVRKLKELGLTESLRPGYRLSPRGRSFLKGLDDDERMHG